MGMVINPGQINHFVKRYFYNEMCIIWNAKHLSMLKECIRLRFFPLTVILEADKISLFPLWPSKWLNKGRRHSWYLSNRTWPPSGEYWMRPRRRRPLPRWRIHSSWWSSSVSSHTHLDRIDPAEIKQWSSCSCKKLASLPYFVRRSITVRMTFCLTGLNLTKKRICC